MKRKLIISMGFILSFAIIFIIITFINGSNQQASQQNLLKETEIESKVDMIERDDDEGEVVMEEITPEETTKAFPERISEVLESTWNFFLSDHIQIVAIGDSLTQGIGDTTNQGGYVGILERTINVDGEIAEFENYGKRGNRSAQLLERLDEKEIRSSIKKADIVLITIGANDIMQVAKENIMNLQLHDFIEQRDQYEQNLGGILDKIRNLNEDTEVYFIGFYNPFEKYFHDIDELDMIVKAYNGTTRSLSKENERVSFIPTLDLFQDSDEELFAEDNFHPNYLGYHKMAKRVLDYITSEES